MAQYPRGGKSPHLRARPRGVAPAGVDEASDYVSAALTSAGVAAVAWQASAVNAQSLTSAGAGAASWQSARIDVRSVSAAGAGAASWQSASVLGRAVTSAGIAAVSWQGGAVIGQTWTSAGVGTAAFASASIAPSTLSTAGLAAATWQSAALKVTQWSAAGVAATAWQAASITAAAWTSAGQGAAAWQGARIEPRTFSASGAATVSFDADTGATIEARTFSAAGAASADWQAASLGQGGQPVHEIDIGGSPLWWHRRDEAESEPKARRKSSGKPSPTKPAEDAAQQARRVIEQAARKHVAQGDLTRNARYADVRLALKPLHGGAIDWTAMYEAMYSLALNDAIARELEIEAQLQDEDDALILLMAA